MSYLKEIKCTQENLYVYSHDDNGHKTHFKMNQILFSTTHVIDLFREQKPLSLLNTIHTPSIIKRRKKKLFAKIIRDYQRLHQLSEKTTMCDVRNRLKMYVKPFCNLAEIVSCHSYQVKHH